MIPPQSGVLVLCVFAAILAVVVVIAVVAAATRRNPISLLPTCRPVSFLSPTELTFFNQLRQHTKLHICCKVKLIELIEVIPGSTQQQRNSIAQKHVDFVLCDPGSMQPVLVIELDDSSHQTKRAQASDRIKNAALASACIRLARVPVGRVYDFRFLKG